MCIYKPEAGHSHLFYCRGGLLVFKLKDAESTVTFYVIAKLHDITQDDLFKQGT
jgi:hypothetical protein